MERFITDGLSVEVKRSARARRICLRIKNNLVLLTLPPKTPLSFGENFIRQNKEWILNRLSPPQKTFQEGDKIMLFGQEITLCHTTGHKPAFISDGHLFVSGEKDFLHQKVSRFISDSFLLFVQKNNPSQQFGISPSRITVKEMTSRWGSCSATKHISLSWRLALAPPFVMDYVIRHEWAHLIEMNHSDKFWALLQSHCPRAKEARTWLKENGKSLFKFKK